MAALLHFGCGITLSSTRKSIECLSARSCRRQRWHGTWEGLIRDADYGLAWNGAAGSHRRVGAKGIQTATKSIRLTSKGPRAPTAVFDPMGDLIGQEASVHGVGAAPCVLIRTATVVIVGMPWWRGGLCGAAGKAKQGHLTIKTDLAALSATRIAEIAVRSHRIRATAREKRAANSSGAKIGPLEMGTRARRDVCAGGKGPPIDDSHIISDLWERASRFGFGARWNLENLAVQGLLGFSGG
ncbi:hypothetical protein DM02DRAFT_650217 [Periconia macrospinosa]|uniref:Uncharacterized protein n=1 Tax=Periconia macrospinosa TaxID=97972 RepID=A0A2V1E9B9_9PLEO|nr:hypothetical protein DM02DRAFT_650217 [Periconia macrospinosa]